MSYIEKHYQKTSTWKQSKKKAERKAHPVSSAEAPRKTKTTPMPPANITNHATKQPGGFPEVGKPAVKTDPPQKVQKKNIGVETDKLSVSKQRNQKETDEALQPALNHIKALQQLKDNVLTHHNKFIIERNKDAVRTCEWAIGRVDTTMAEIRMLDDKFADALDANEHVMANMYKSQMSDATKLATREVTTDLNSTQSNGIDINNSMHLAIVPRRTDGAPGQFSRNSVPDSFKLVAPPETYARSGTADDNDTFDLDNDMNEQMNDKNASKNENKIEEKSTIKPNGGQESEDEREPVEPEPPPEPVASK